MASTCTAALRLTITVAVRDGRSLRDIARAADVAHTLVAKFAAGGDIRLSSAEAIATALGCRLTLERNSTSGH